MKNKPWYKAIMRILHTVLCLFNLVFLLSAATAWFEGDIPTLVYFCAVMVVNTFICVLTIDVWGSNNGK